MKARLARALVGAVAVATAAAAGAQTAEDPFAPPGSDPSAPSDAPTAAPEPPAPSAPPPKSTGKKLRRRLPGVPRYLGGGFTYGTVTSSAPGVGTLRGRGWNIYAAWDVTRWLDAGFRGGATRVQVGWTPNPLETRSPGETGFVGLGLLARLRPGRLVDPWLAADAAYQAVTWNDYLHSIGGWGVLGSAGVDLHVWRWGLVRLGVSYASFTGTTRSGYGQTGPLPGPEDDGATAGMRTLWFTAGWLFDLGSTEWH